MRRPQRAHGRATRASTIATRTHRPTATRRPLGLEESCEREVVAQLVELQKAAAAYASRDGHVAEDEYFFAEQNARLAMNAEEYYRSMFRGRVPSWNLRDQHMVDTLDALMQHLGRRRPSPKVVVWAHNSHLGNAGATEMGRRGELNVGQLVKNRFGAAARLIGFTTHDGTVTAAGEWDGPAEQKRVTPSLPGSIEAGSARARRSRASFWTCRAIAARSTRSCTRISSARSA